MRQIHLYRSLTQFTLGESGYSTGSEKTHDQQNVPVKHIKNT
jgi:hypothetical protein